MAKDLLCRTIDGFPRAKEMTDFLRTDSSVWGLVQDIARELEQGEVTDAMVAFLDYLASSPHDVTPKEIVIVYHTSVKRP